MAKDEIQYTGWNSGMYTFNKKQRDNGSSKFSSVTGTNQTTDAFNYQITEDKQRIVYMDNSDYEANTISELKGNLQELYAEFHSLCLTNQKPK